MAEKPNDMYAAIQENTKNQSVLIITADDVQDLEFFYPYYRFIEEGYHVDVATPNGGEFKGKAGMGLKKSTIIDNVRSDDYELLYIPGGKAPEELKKNKTVLGLVNNFVTSGKPIAAFCHGPLVLAEAGVISGRNIAAWPETKDEIEKAGATYISQPTVVDEQFITGRWPGDLPSHLAITLQILKARGSKGDFKAA